MEHWHNKYYDIAAESDVGERSENQDAYGINISEHDAEIVVCDGMGGFEGGKAAGQLAVSEMLRFLIYRAAKGGKCMPELHA